MKKEYMTSDFIYLLKIFTNFDSFYNFLMNKNPRMKFLIKIIIWKKKGTMREMIKFQHICNKKLF